MAVCVNMNFSCLAFFHRKICYFTSHFRTQRSTCGLLSSSQHLPCIYVEHFLDGRTLYMSSCRRHTFTSNYIVENTCNRIPFCLDEFHRVIFHRISTFFLIIFFSGISHSHIEEWRESYFYGFFFLSQYLKPIKILSIREMRDIFFTIWNSNWNSCDRFHWSNGWPVRIKLDQWTES